MPLSAPPIFLRNPRGWAAAALLLIFAGAFYRASLLPPPSGFSLSLPAVEAGRAPQWQAGFVSDHARIQVHASSLVELNDGHIRAFWFAGSREGAADVQIMTAVYDPRAMEWGAEHTVTGREATQRDLWRYVAKVGNPVPSRASDGSLWLYYVTVSLGGWAGSSITALQSKDEGESWGQPHRLITSPFLNISTLVRAAPITYQDGTQGLPVYHEFISKFGELLRIDGGAVYDKQRLAPGGRGSLQPVVLVQDAARARADASFRHGAASGVECDDG